MRLHPPPHAPIAAIGPLGDLGEALDRPALAPACAKDLVEADTSQSGGPKLADRGRRAHPGDVPHESGSPRPGQPDAPADGAAGAGSAAAGASSSSKSSRPAAQTGHSSGGESPSWT